MPYSGIGFDKLVDRMAEKTIGANVVNAKDALDAYIGGHTASKMENIAALGDSAELADVVAKVNAILAGMKTAGIMEKDASSDT